MHSEEKFASLGTLIGKEFEFQKHSLIRTPFLHLELLGVTVPRPPRLEIRDGEARRLRNAVLSPSWPAALNNVRRRYVKDYETYFKRLPILSKAALQRRMKGQGEHFPPRAGQWFLNSFGSLRKKDLSFMYNRLAVEAAYRLQYPRDLDRYIHAQYMADLPSSLENNLDLTQMGGLNYQWFSMKQAIQEKLRKHEMHCTPIKRGRAILQAVTDFVKINAGRDLVDSELIQFLCTGRQNGPNREPVVGFVGADWQSVIYRIALYKSAIDFSFQQFARIKGRPPPGISPGRVVVVGKNCEVIERFNVDDIPPLFFHLDDAMLSP